MSPVEPVRGALHEGVGPVGAQSDSGDGEVGQPQPLLVVVLGQHLAPLPNGLEGHYARPPLHLIKRLQRNPP